MNKFFNKIIYLLLILCFGCASIGRPIKNTGQAMGKTGTGILMLSGVTWVLIPIGVGLSMPCYILGAPLYYGGCSLCKEKPEKQPFNP